MEMAVRRTTMAGSRQNAEALDLMARKKLARKAKRVFGDAPGLMDALETQRIYTSERTAQRWLRIMSEKGYVQDAVRSAMRHEASRIIQEMEAIIRGDFR